MDKKRIKRILFFVILILTVMTLFLFINNYFFQSINNRITSSRLHLKYITAEINEYNKINGQYPESLSSFNAYREFISDKHGNNQVYDTLNGEGGWFYDKNTGVVKINLVKPLKEYMWTWIYFDEFKNDVPASWDGQQVYSFIGD